MYGLNNIWKTAIWGCKKKSKYRKIIFKIVQMEFSNAYY